MQFDYPHTLGQADALSRVGVLCTYLKNRHGIEVEWDGNIGTIDGKYLVVTIQGTMTIDEDCVTFEGRDPGLLWRKKAVNYLKNKLATYLDPSTPIDELPTDKS